MTDETEIAEMLYACAERNGLIETLYAVFGTDIRINLPYCEKHCSEDVDALGLSTRALNALRRSRMSTVGSAIAAIEEERLQNTKNLGRKTVNEIKTRLLLYGYAQLTDREKRLFFRDLVQNNGEKPAAPPRKHRLPEG